MTTTMMRLRQHLGLASSSPAIIYTSAIARLGNNNRRRTSTTTSRTTTQKQLLLLLVVILLAVFLLFSFVLIPTVLLPPARPRTMSSSSASASSAAPFEKPRAIVKKVLAESQPEGQGATVRRSIGRHELRNLDPFLMLDEFSVSKPAGFPDHPHRGFETVTYMLESRRRSNLTRRTTSTRKTWATTAESRRRSNLTRRTTSTRKTWATTAEVLRRSMTMMEMIMMTEGLSYAQVDRRSSLPPFQAVPVVICW